jgi:uncharacterized protein (DUF488 family)
MSKSAIARVFHTRSVRICSVGHGRRKVEELIAILREADVRTLADIRTVPGSRRHPQFGQAPLRESLARAGIGYVHLRRLGGRRDPRPDSPHTALRVDAFRGYADHMTSADFARDLTVLEERGRSARTAVMCAETQWTECHRRLLSDLLVTRGWDVTHLLTAGASEPHRLWDVARVVDEGLVYDGGAVALPDGGFGR